MGNFFNKYFIYSILLLAFALRFWGIADLKHYIGDESVHIPPIESYFETGHLKKFWYHPPAKHFILSGSMKIFGNNPYGWRMANVIFGSMTVLAVFLLGKELFDGKKIACIAALLLAVDPLHIFISRSSYGEIPSVFFFTMCVYVTVRYIKGKTNSPILAGFLFGLAIADRWYYLVALAAILAYISVLKFKERGFYGIAHIFMIYVVLPMGIYLLAFYPWFKQGYNLPEFFQMQIDSYKELQSLTVESFQSQFAAFMPSSPLEWFVKPLVSVIPIENAGAWGKFIVTMNNFPVWCLALPAAAYIAYYSWKYRDRYAALVFILFISIYFQFMLVKRPIFLYSAIMVLPFVCLSVSFLLVSFIEAFKRGFRCYVVLLTGIALWSMYLYPFVTIRMVPVSLYAPLLSLARITSLFSR